ncbi:hypothetical protein Ccrd_023850 [Cynara cardunculus var. scolymus]|uniref:phospholipid:diacylglycerol acyltransferase n=1 Tax=Cynara cardunculus var. scolymus TaxID=59895 RepID=A0A103XW01_CYNCS|nr:hypothetical protein Ccrd_023850 [Cynara cardunculus var. scolymus]
MSLLRRRKRPDDDAPQPPHTAEDDDKKGKSQKKSAKKKRRNSYSCVDNCCWLVGCICTTWWFLLFLYNTMPASFPQYLTEKITGALPDPPGVKCVKEGLEPKHPVVFVPGIVTGGLELWEGHECAEGLFRKRLWGGTFGEIYRRPSCWLQHMSLDNETGLDPAGIRVRPVSGLVAADYFAPGYFVWAVLIANLARVGYEEKNMYMAAYDWRLSFQNTEVRDRTLSRIKRNIELMVEINDGQKAVIIPHSMGVLYFLHFMKWVEAPAPMGGGGGSDWCAKHIKAVMNIGGPLLGAPKALSGLFSAEAKDVAFASGIKAISEYKAYTAGDLLDMLELPNAPDMEIYSLYGVGIPTERAYVYKLAPTAECYIPFQIDNTAGDTDEHVCLKDGVYTVDGDETVPALSAGFMCAKGWRGKTRFNPSGIKTYIREYDHNPPSNFLEGRGTQSGAHVDIMGNFQLIEDVIRVAAGGSGEQLGGDRVYTDIFKWSDKINIKL